jgi:hypothetical protein
MTIFQPLQNRVDAKDGFLHDFEIEAYVIPVICSEEEDGNCYEPEDGVESILFDYWDDWCLKFYIHEGGNFDDISYCDRTLNWNIQKLEGGIFNEHYISFSIHELYHHTIGWSFFDIVKINHLMADIKVIYQHYKGCLRDWYE